MAMAQYIGPVIFVRPMARLLLTELSRKMVRTLLWKEKSAVEELMVNLLAEDLYSTSKMQSVRYKLPWHV